MLHTSCPDLKLSLQERCCIVVRAAKGFTRPVLSKAEIRCIPDDVLDAHVDLTAKRKLNRNLRSHTHESDFVKVGDLVQVSLKTDNARWGYWSSPRAVLAIDLKGGLITVPGRGMPAMSAAFEDTCVVPHGFDHSSIVQSAIDDLDGHMEEMLGGVNANDICSPPTEQGSIEDNSDDESKSDAGNFSGEPPMLPTTGERVEIFWSLNRQ